MSSSTPVWPLFQTVFGSIIQVILVCIAGYVLARRGILDKKTQKQLNIINVNFFTPCLLFSKVAFFLSPAKLRELWIIPIFFMLVSVVSLVVAWLLAVSSGSTLQRNFAMAAATFMNSNSLPVALLQSLVVTVPGLKWGKDDNKDAMVGRALTYLLLCSTLGQFSGPGPPRSAALPAITLDQPQDEPHLHPHRGAHRNRTCADVLLVPKHAVHVQRRPPADDCRTPPLPMTVRKRGTPPDACLGAPAAYAPPPHRAALRATWRAVTNFLTPPLWASLPLQHMLEAHLRPVKGALTQAGNCSIPITLVVLGAYFYRPAPPDAPRSWRRASLASSLRELFSVKGGEEREENARDAVVRTRSSGSSGEGKTDNPRVFEDPVFILSLVLLLAAPPALTLSQITQAVSGDAFERLISRTIFWSYCVVTPPAMVGYALVAMLIAKL
ncbi:membrane transport protein-domain-containing protein [Gloeopeniophorella convolvens]|nr:membrane transport protein-domain-containing protein [Gloeopeniophorella convolvens]